MELFASTNPALRRENVDKLFNLIDLHRKMPPEIRAVTEVLLDIIPAIEVTTSDAVAIILQMAFEPKAGSNVRVPAGNLLKRFVNVVQVTDKQEISYDRYTTDAHYSPEAIVKANLRIGRGKFKYPFGEIWTGDFIIAEDSYLLSLEGCPDVVMGSFKCLCPLGAFNFGIIPRYVAGDIAHGFARVVGENVECIFPETCETTELKINVQIDEVCPPDLNEKLIAGILEISPQSVMGREVSAIYAKSTVEVKLLTADFVNQFGDRLILINKSEADPNGEEVYGFYKKAGAYFCSQNKQIWMSSNENSFFPASQKKIELSYGFVHQPFPWLAHWVLTVRSESEELSYAFDTEKSLKQAVLQLTLLAGNCELSLDRVDRLLWAHESLSNAKDFRCAWRGDGRMLDGDAGHFFDEKSNVVSVMLMVDNDEWFPFRNYDGMKFLLLDYGFSRVAVKWCPDYISRYRDYFDVELEPGDIPITHKILYWDLRIYDEDDGEFHISMPSRYRLNKFYRQVKTLPPAELTIANLKKIMKSLYKDS